MELTLDQALQGLRPIKMTTQEADQYYTTILKTNPKHPDANHNMGSWLLVLASRDCPPILQNFHED